MRRLRIPAELVGKLKPLAEIPTAAISQLAEELESQLVLKLVLDDDISDIVNACLALRDQSHEARDALVEIVTGIHLLQVTSGDATAKLISDIVEIYSEEFEQSNSDSSVETLRTNLGAILSLTKVRASVKALELLNDRDKLYLQSRIVSSLRPVFDNDLDKPCLASLITHSLKIVVRSGGETSNLYVSMDSYDLRELRRSIDKAIHKAASIAAKVDSAGNREFGQVIEVEAEDE